MKKNTFLFYVLLLALFYPTYVQAQLQPIGIFDHHQDVGNPAIKGSAVYDASEQTYTVSSAGVNMWAAADQFHFLWKKIKGDFIVRATVQFIGEGPPPNGPLLLLP